MELGHPGPTAAQYGLGHLEPYLSVSKAVGPVSSTNPGAHPNQKLDVMLVQYFLLSTANWVDVERGDMYEKSFWSDKTINGSFPVDGKWGKKTFAGIKLYQTYAGDPIEGLSGSIDRWMFPDGIVNPAPQQNQGLPVSGTTEGGLLNMYTIAHMNERYKVIYPAYNDFMIADTACPPELRAEISRLLPPSAGNASSGSSVGGMASYHVARSRHFPIRR